MADHTDLIQLARKRGDEKIDVAIGQLHKQAEILANAAGIPDNIKGLAPGAMLGRISYVPSQSIELKRALSQALSSIELNKITEHATTLDVREEMDTVPQIEPTGIDVAKNLADTDLPPPLVAALNTHDLHTLGDVMGVPDEHLLKMRGIGARSLEQIKRAIR